MLDLGLEDLDVDGSRCFLEVILKHMFSDCLHFKIVRSSWFFNIAANSDLIFEYGVHATEELEDILSVEGFSGGEVAAKSVLIRWNEIDLHVLL